jgi:hypothetical protein
MKVERAVALLCVAMSPACAAQHSLQYEVLLRAESDEAVPPAGVVFSANGRRIGQSDAHGLLIARLPGRAGESVSLDSACPEGYRASQSALSVLLRPLVERGKRPEYRVVCPPSTRSLVLAVRASNGPNLPVRYLGKEITRTDALGAAHALLKVSAGDTLSVTLDTSAHENTELMPQQPELKLTVPEHDDIVVFDQPFTRPKPKIKRVVKEPVGPQRI